MAGLEGQEGLGHVSRPRNYIFEKPVFESRFPCKLPPAVLTLPGSSHSNCPNKIPQTSRGILFGGPGGTRTLDILLKRQTL